MNQSQRPDACGMSLTLRVENASCTAVCTRQTKHFLRSTIAEPFFLVPTLTRTRYVQLWSETQTSHQAPLTTWYPCTEYKYKYMLLKARYIGAVAIQLNV